MIVISNVYAIRPSTQGFVGRHGAGVFLQTLTERLTDAWSRRVARAYAEARLAEVTLGDSRMLGELQAVASRQRA